MMVVDYCAGMDGTLSANNKTLIEGMLHGGDGPTWQLAREIVISPLPLMTLGMAVKRIARPIIAESIPDPFTIYRALRFSMARRAQFQDNPEPFDIES